MKSLRSFSYRPGILLLILVVMFAISCASRPDAELQLAQQAMEEAQALQAADFAAADWQDANKIWDEAQTALADESYGNARALLVTAKTRFEKAASIAKSNREMVLQEVQALQTPLNQGLISLKSSVAAARLSAAARKEIEQAAGEVESAIQEFNAQMDQGELAKARISGQEAMKKLNEVQMRLETP